MRSNRSLLESFVLRQNILLVSQATNWRKLKFDKLILLHCFNLAEFHSLEENGTISTLEKYQWFLLVLSEAVLSVFAIYFPVFLTSHCLIVFFLSKLHQEICYMSNLESLSFSFLKMVFSFLERRT